MKQLIAHTIEGGKRPASYDPNSPLGQGGAGIAFADKSRPGYVIKLYKRITDHMNLQPGVAAATEIAEARQKIEAMLQAPPDHQTASDGSSTFTQVAWPQELLLTADGRFVGFTMREVDFSNSVPLEQLFLEGQRSAKGLPQDFEYRLIAAQNLSSILDLVHRKGHAIVDLQPQNVRVYKKNGWVGLIDCDGYRISATKIYHARFLRADFAAPELQRSGSNVRPDMGDEYQDRFALALLIFSLLNDGVTPFNVRARAGQTIPNDVPSRIRDRLYGYGRIPNPLVESAAKASIHEHFPDFLRDLFDRAFLNEGANRPMAGEWSSALQKLLKDASPCKKVQRHGNSVLAGKCMLCARQVAIDALSISAVSQVSYTRAPPQPVAPIPLPPPPAAPAGVTALPGFAATATHGSPPATMKKGVWQRLRRAVPAPPVLAISAAFLAIWYITPLSGLFFPQRNSAVSNDDAAVEGAAASAGRVAAAAAIEESKQLAAAALQQRIAASKASARQVATIVDRPMFSRSEHLVTLTDVDISILRPTGAEVFDFGRIASVELKRSISFVRPRTMIEIRGNAASGFGSFFRDIDCLDDDASCLAFYNKMIEAVVEWRGKYPDLALTEFTATAAPPSPSASASTTLDSSATPGETAENAGSPGPALANAPDTEIICDLSASGGADEVLTRATCLARGGKEFRLPN